MKPSTVIAFAAATGIAVLGIFMATTKPSQAEYEEYAAQRLSEYLKDNVCVKTPSLLGSLIKFDCSKIVDSASPQIKGLISETTKTQDFLIFRVYHTDLKLNSFLPSYKFESVGAFDNFYTYKLTQS
ncbi:MAG: DUF4359 domain-containing protein [Cyanobacteria bacterium P01_A01_bin.45]